MTAVLWIWKIISWNFRIKYQQAWIAKIKIIFHLAAHMRDNITLLSKSGQFYNQIRSHNSGKLQKNVTLRVWEIIWFKKREKVLTSVLYKYLKCFSPGGPNIGWSVQREMLNFTNDAKNARLFAKNENSPMCHEQHKYWFWV